MIYECCISDFVNAFYANSVQITVEGYLPAWRVARAHVVIQGIFPEVTDKLRRWEVGLGCQASAATLNTDKLITDLQGQPPQQNPSGLRSHDSLRCACE